MRSRAFAAVAACGRRRRIELAQTLKLFKGFEKVLKLFQGFESSHFEKCSTFRKVFKVLKIFKGALWSTRERTRSYVHVPPGERALVSARSAVVGRGQCFCIILLRALASLAFFESVLSRG